MGFYINQTASGILLPSRGKAKMLIEDGAIVVEPKFQPNLICVVENGPFDAVGYCFSENEFKVFNDPGDNRRKTWLIYSQAAELSGYNK